MSMVNNNSKIEVKIDLPTLKVVLSTEAEIDQIEGILEKLLDSITKVNKKISKIAEIENIIPKVVYGQTPVVVAPQIQTSTDDPLSLIAFRMDTDLSQLKNSSIMGIKDGKVQILKPQKFGAVDAVLVMLLCYEVGLKKQSISYEELKLSYQDSGIKGNTPFGMVINNIKVGGFIDKAKYESTKEITLSAKGQTKAIEYFKKALGS